MGNPQDPARGGAESAAAGERLYRRVKNYVQAQGMIHPGEAVIAGVSGGADSLCLFELLRRLSGELGFALEVVHVHHGLRAAAEEDLRFVEDLCARAGVPCRLVRVDAAAEAEARGCGVEEAGRRLRYEAFHAAGRDLSAALGAPYRIAVAHHREDQAETILFHLCRGTDLRGARGMLPVQGHVIRPLLTQSRAGIEACLAGMGLSWRTDETNADTSYTRNFLRREIFPRLAEGVSPAASDRIAGFGAACAEAERYLAQMTRQAAARCMAEAGREGDTPVVSVPSLLAEDPYLQGRILYQCLCAAAGSRRDLRAVHVEAVRGLCARGGDGRLSMPGGAAVVRSADRLFFLPGDRPEAAGRLRQGSRYPFSAREYRCRIRPFDGNLSAIPQNQYTKWFDYDKIGTFPVFRTRQPGDRMSIRANAGHGPAGSGEGPAGRLVSKKLARIMLDGKMPAAVRDAVVLPFAGQEALWIPGLRMGDRWKVSSQTRQVLEVAFLPSCTRKADPSPKSPS